MHREIPSENSGRRIAKSLWLIQQGLEEYIFPKVAAADHAKHAWDTLEIAYQGTDKVKNAKLQTLRKSFETLQMKDSDFVDHFMTHVTSIVNQLCTPWRRHSREKGH
jgi:hypothetical protein